MSQVIVKLCAVIAAVTEETPRVLVIQREGPRVRDDGALVPGAAVDALPSGPLDPLGHRTLERALRGWVREQTGIEFGYVEQLYTFGDRHRDPAEAEGGARVVSVAYLALVRERSLSASQWQARWLEWYALFPWEDWREGRPALLDRELIPAFERWSEQAPDAGARAAREERAQIAFGLGEMPWDGDRVLERYELLYELGLVEEARRDRALLGERAAGGGLGGPLPLCGRLGPGMSLDHRRVLASALGRLRGKLRYRPVVFELLAPTFTLLRLQRVVEALAGGRLHKQNFRRLVERAGLVEGTGVLDHETGGRPAERFTFRREVVRERPAPGVGLPGIRR